MPDIATPYRRLGLVPHDIITFDDWPELVAFENVVAEAVEPLTSVPEKEAWLARVALREEIQVPRFNGRLLDLQLTVMNDPYHQLISAKRRGWVLKGNNYDRTGESSMRTLDCYTGFKLTATAKSTGKPPIGIISTELWYFPVPILRTNGGHQYKTSYSHGGCSVQRVVAKPRLEKDKFIEFDEAAKHVGFTVLRKQMMHARSQPIRN